MNMNIYELDALMKYNSEKAAQVKEAQEIIEHMMNVEEFLATTTWEQKPEADGYYHKKLRIPEEFRTSSSDKEYKHIKRKTLEELKEECRRYLLNPGKEEKKKNVRHTLADAWNTAVEKMSIPSADPGATASSENTVATRQGFWRRCFVKYKPGEALADRYLDTITADDLETFTAKAVAELELDRNYLHGLLSCLSMAFEAAAGKRWIPAELKTAYEMANFREAQKRALLSPTNAEKSFSEEDLRLLYELTKEQLEKDPDDFAAYAYLMQWELAARRGEMPAIKESDINGRTLTINRFVVYSQKTKKEFVRETTKTKRARYDFISDLSLEIVAKVKEIKARKGIQSDFLFPSLSSETGCIRYDSTTQFHKKLVRLSKKRYEDAKKAGVPEDQLPHFISTEIPRGTHAWRKDKATALTNKYGVDFAAGVLGHTPQTDRGSYYIGFDEDAGVAAFNETSWLGKHAENLFPPACFPVE